MKTPQWRRSPSGTWEKVRGLDPVVDGGLDEVVRALRNLQDLLGVHVEVAEGEGVGAIRHRVPALEDGDHRPARGAQEVEVELGLARLCDTLLGGARELGFKGRREERRAPRAPRPEQGRVPEPVSIAPNRAHGEPWGPSSGLAQLEDVERVVALGAHQLRRQEGGDAPGTASAARRRDRNVLHAIDLI